MPAFPVRKDSFFRRRSSALLLEGTVLLGIVALTATTVFAAIAPQPRVATPVPPFMPARLVVPEARLPIELRHVAVQAEVAGLAVATRIELEFYNPNERVLEGELQFPLLEGQSIAGFALDIDGELRPAVPVEKAKGQQDFEDVTRTRVDPALLEATQGNNYKLRLYPLPGRGARRVVLEIAEILSAGNSTAAGTSASALAWRLPLQFGSPVGRLDVAVRFAGAAPLSARLGSAVLPMQRAKDENGMASLTFTRSNYRGSGVLHVALPATAVPLTLSVQEFRGQTYFYAEFDLVMHSAPRAKPRNIALIWDASGSGAARDHGKELAVLDQYFKRIGQVQVQLLTVRDTAAPVETFAIAGGNWQLLRQRLETMVYDGATQLGAMQPPSGTDLALLFTDGLGNYGDAPLSVAPIPLYAVNAASSADAGLLRRVAEQSGGAYLDLLNMTSAGAVQALGTERTRLVAMRGTGVRDLETASVYVQNGRLMVAGILTEPEAEMVLEIQAPGGVRRTRTVHLKARAPASAQGATALAARRWATLRLAVLEADYERNKAAIRRLGLDFGMLSRETSLIVLDNVADYARYEIEPPTSLRAKWQDLMASKSQTDATAKARHIDRVAADFADKQSWWDKRFPKGEPPAPPKPAAAMPGGAPVSTMAAPPPAPVPAPASMPSGAAAAAAAAAERARNESTQRSSSAGRPGVADAASQSASIQLRKWQPDEPYARRLREAKSEDLYAIYLDERPAYAASTAFFLDVADILFERGQPELGSRVLSNLAEMNLENRHVLRILAYRLLLAKQVKPALPVLQKVLALSPNEPQSYRDLGLALAADGQSQQAIDRLWEVVSRPWNNRFPGVELIALAELNAIVARQPGMDTRRIDARLLRNLPLELRAVLTWDADNTDIDLWLIDPNGERSYYGNRLTYQGGRMSPDFTGGYGPEEYSLRVAKPGSYTVKAQFYGHRQQIVAPSTTLMLKLSTGFGTPAQKDEDIVLRLSGRGDDVTVGTFTVGAAP
ncbi:DUF2135 domain-containing protein [Massilia glaciei]|uniref:DUF2135 domain-containing protein n=2 Tax=Massilia glaciei TaxID=1524097 RepID=A0A2U2HKE1_9BURK|nr:DUF2135 domain-containing protein [Massilia glaciei]